MEIKNVVVGSGFAGACIARRIADIMQEEVLIIEKRKNIGGNAYDTYNEHGIMIHKYGPHIFHTNSKEVWDWVIRFSEFNLYQHRVLAYVDGNMVPIPITSDTINYLYNLNLSSDETGEWLKGKAEDIEDIKNSEDVVLSKAGKEIYEKFFKNYTFKQWNRYASELGPSVIRRVPIRSNRDTRYFTDKYQGIPRFGYSKMFENIVNHPKIKVLLNTDWFDVKDQFQYDKLYYTGEIDRFFGYEFGKLEYRSCRFDYETYFDREYYQEVGTVNYPNDYDFTRISEYKHMTGQKINCTTIAKEYPCDLGEPFYVVPDKENKHKVDEYYKLARKVEKTIFVGRLAEYKYYNMDAIIERILKIELQR